MNTLIGLPTRGDVKQALRHLAKGADGLDETYRLAMKRVEGQGHGYHQLAKKILAWIVLAKRSLSTLELQLALAIRPRLMKLDEDYLPAIRIIRSVCAGLVTVDEGSGVIRLVHYTTQEYFQRTWTEWFPDGHIDITTVCTTYLSFSVFKSGSCRTDNEFEERLRSNPFYDYAASNWGHHAREASPLPKEVRGFLECKASVQASSQALMAPKRSWWLRNYSQRIPRQLTGLHLAAYFGVPEAVKGLLCRGRLSVKDSSGRTPLLYAAENGHATVVELLLTECGINPSITVGTDQTILSWTLANRLEPLIWAAQKGHEGVVKTLLAKDVDLESKDGKGWTPLLYAAANRHEAVVRLLLEKGADVEAKDRRYGRTPLSYATEMGHRAVVRLLLDKGADVDAKDRNDRTPLAWAAANRHEAVVRQLLEKGADVDAKDNSGRTPLLYAVEYGHEAIVQQLLEKNADVEAKDRNDRTSLAWAAANRHEAVVRLLLEKGADVDAKSNYGRTPLWYAAANRHEAVVRMLLEKSADVEAKDSYGQTPLSWAAANRHEAVVRLLLEKSAEVEAKDS